MRFSNPCHRIFSLSRLSFPKCDIGISIRCAQQGEVERDQEDGTCTGRVSLPVSGLRKDRSTHCAPYSSQGPWWWSSSLKSGYPVRILPPESLRTVSQARFPESSSWRRSHEISRYIRIGVFTSEMAIHEREEKMSAVFGKSCQFKRSGTFGQSNEPYVHIPGITSITLGVHSEHPEYRLL